MSESRSSEKVSVADATSSKKEIIQDMFDRIAPRYDLLNRVLSAGIDQSWRRKTIRNVQSVHPKRILDLATGTGDLAIMASRLQPDGIVGVDIAEEMLVIGREKIKKRGLESLIELKHCDAEDLPFQDGAFDAATVAFGVRNFENLSTGLLEIHRVLGAGGMLAVLEFSKPTAFPVKQLYTFYGKWILPTVGRLISGDSRAYTYLPESISAFPDGEDFLEIMRDVGFLNVHQERLTFGIASIYTGLVR